MGTVELCPELEDALENELKEGKYDDDGEEEGIEGDGLMDTELKVLLRAAIPGETTLGGRGSGFLVGDATRLGDTMGD